MSVLLKKPGRPFKIRMRIMTEDETIGAALAGKSLSRFGDGELRLALGNGSSCSQCEHPGLMEEMRHILATPKNDVVVCIPRNDPHSPKRLVWDKYWSPKFKALYRQNVYGSSLITRPDSAPWINTESYWKMVEKLWAGRDVVFVAGDERSLTVSQITVAARTLALVKTTSVNAYEHINETERYVREIVGTFESPLVILCAGATATALAYRLADTVQALDLGHIGMFMRRFEKTRMTA